MADAGELSKSAKKRAAKKARDEAHADEAPAAPAAPAPKAKAKAAASAPAGGYPEPKAKAKAKAEPKAEPKAKAKADPAPKAKAKAKAEPAPAPAPKAEPKAEPKAKASSKAKAKAKAVPVEEPKPVEPQEFVAMDPWVIDDGTGPAWEESSGKSKKQQRREDRVAQEKAAAKLNPKAVGDKYIPGLAGAPIPGMAPPGANSKANVNQSVNATGAAAAAAAKAAAEAAAAQEKVSGSTAFVKVPEDRIGIVIGPKGAKIKLIQEKTGTRIDTSGEQFTITGPPDGVADAERAVLDLVQKGYTHLAFDDFAENCCMVPGTSFPDLIGKQGCIVQAIKKELNVEVSFPPTTKGGENKKYKVTIAGATKNVEKCKEVINDIVQFGHHEVTHPGIGHEEMEVPEWCYAAVIGKKGCELRHIQNSYKVTVKIPRADSVNQNVILIGETYQIPKAKNYIEKALWNFQNQVKGRDRSDGSPEDPWGDEEPMEDWMKSYMYKR
eukprot:TRINITY_DN1744_c0_g1_i2.p2 TRINITY_DN1744_c0_g1~~TRINITY_DN1744_c0_g1_i2.p2  ORF type:complete len:495 (-),score=212.67 TRINITY_DN1744_c0_g1_i2:93-1577(-)